MRSSSVVCRCDLIIFVYLFVSRAAQKLSLSRSRKSKSGSAPSGPLLYTGGFSGALQLSPPAVPPCLLRAGTKVKEMPGMGKVRVMIRISSVHISESSESTSFLKVDNRKKQLSLSELPVAGPRHRSPPKTFAFDAIFPHDCSQAEVCSGTVTDVIQSVVNGADGSIFCYGPTNLGKTYTMIGRDCSTQSLGVAPTAISWLFKVLAARQEKAGTHAAVWVSAVEISGHEETLTDLLAPLASSPIGPQEALGPAVSLKQDPLCGSQLQNQTELKATDAERAAFYLDAALAARRSSRVLGDQNAQRNSHFLFTLYLYQERKDNKAVGQLSGRSRLHLLDLGSCEMDISRTREGGGGQCLSLSALGNVILALANGAKQVPYRDSKLTMLLSESLGNINCQSTMIAHISDSPADFMETLTTVQLAARIHRIRKKKAKYASSSSGGESSCEEGLSHRPPQLRPFHPRTMALDPDTPPLLSSDPDYSSSSEHSCDTVIYVGPRGTAISDQELSDNEGPPSFVPIIPSLNKRRVRDTPRSDGDHLKCNTFAELQQRLDCIDGSEGPASFTPESRTAALSSQIGATEPIETTSPPKPHQSSSEIVSESALTTCTSKPDQEQSKVSSTAGLFSPSWLGEDYGMSSTAGISHQALVGGQPLGPVVMEGAFHTNRYPTELSGLRAALFGRCYDGDFLRTTVTLQQPVELNGEDELVFTVVEELPCGLVPDNGRPSHVLPFHSDYPLQASGSRPVSIISSINDKYDAYTSQQGAWGPEVDNHGQETLLPRDKTKSTSTSLYDSGICFSEQDSDPATPKKPCFTKRIPFPNATTRASLKGSLKVKTNSRSPSLSAQITHHTSCSSLPRKTKPAFSSGLGSSRQEAGDDDFLLQKSSHFDPGEVEFLCAGKPSRSGTSSSSKRPVGSSNSVPRPPKAQVTSSGQRIVEGCEKSSSKRGDTLLKLPRLTRGATTLGTGSVPQSSESTSLTASVRFASLGKKTNEQKSSMVSKCGNGNTSPTALPVRHSGQEQKTKTAVSPCALKTSVTGKSSFPKTSISEEEFFRADSFSQTMSSLKIEYGSARTSSSLKTRDARADSSEYNSNQPSLERCDSQTFVGSKSQLCATLGANGRSNRSLPRLGVPASPSSSASSCLGSPGILTTTSKLGQVRGCSSLRAVASGGSKARTLSSSSKSPSSSPKPSDKAAGRNSSLPLIGKSPTRSGTGTKTGRGIILGTKQGMSRVANSRVRELAAGSPRKQLSRGHGLTGSDSRTSSISGSPVNLAIPSPYSKITAPRRPQCYSSGHGSDNSSILSGELPPAMGRTALFYHSGGSSGYESTIRDSETTGSTSSAQDSMSDSGVTSSSRSRLCKSPKKRGNGFVRRRLIPAPLPDPSSLGRKVKEPFEIKVYEIDNVEHLQRRREMGTPASFIPTHILDLTFRQQQIKELTVKHKQLKLELDEAKSRLMLHPDKWNGEFDVGQDLDPESQHYLEVLAQATAELEYCVNLCKSRVMMETCFDITMTTAGAAQGGQQDVEV
uniref:Kinesin family member 26Aa n=1 Tax=Echeneis naucrates TaxID=173247 RepID=A0A665UFV1_ECHNA